MHLRFNSSLPEPCCTCYIGSPFVVAVQLVVAVPSDVVPSHPSVPSCFAEIDKTELNGNEHCKEK